MKTSQKQLIAKFKETKGKFTVMAFDPHTMRRSSAYCGIDMVTALQEISFRLMEDRPVLLLDAEKEESTLWEMKNLGRVPYEVAKQWAIVFRK